MEFLFYIVACLGVIAVSFPLFAIAANLEKLASVVSYTPDGFPPPIDDEQLSFAFATNNESKNQEELTDKDKEIYLSHIDRLIDIAQSIPFLPDDSKVSEEEE